MVEREVGMILKFKKLADCYALDIEKELAGLCSVKFISRKEHDDSTITLVVELEDGKCYPTITYENGSIIVDLEYAKEQHIAWDIDRFMIDSIQLG